MFLVFAALAVFSIQVTVFIQTSTPVELLGKVIGLLMLAGLIGTPLGSWLFGILFEYFGETPWVVMLPAALLAILIALWSRVYFKSVPFEPRTEG